MLTSGPPVRRKRLTTINEGHLPRIEQAMDRDQFWALIEQARTETGGDCAPPHHRRCPVAAHAAAQLAMLGLGEVVAFEQVLREVQAESYRYDLWGAAVLINHGGGDDGFEDFRGWLIGQGQSTYEAALRNPDSLASHPRVCSRDPRYLWHNPLECQDMLCIAVEAYDAITGHEGPDKELGPWPRRDPGPDWDFSDDAELQRRYPRLWACLGHDA